MELCAPVSDCVEMQSFSGAMVVLRGGPFVLRKASARHDAALPPVTGLPFLRPVPLPPLSTSLLSSQEPVGDRSRENIFWLILRRSSGVQKLNQVHGGRDTLLVSRVFN
jgi:hypothetical protein